MATVYIERAQDKLAGLLAGVSDSTDAVTQRADARETVRALSEVRIESEFTSTTTLAERNSAPKPCMFNGEVVAAAVSFGDGGHGTAAGQTDYVSYVLRKWDASGLNTTTVATWSPTTGTSAVGIRQALTITGTAARIVAGGTMMFSVLKVGAGVTSGACTISAILRRDDD